jgi:hypothetical protein
MTVNAKSRFDCNVIIKVGPRWNKWYFNGNSEQHLIIEVGKSVPLQVWRGPVGSRKLRFPNYVTMAQDDGKVFSLMHRPLLPRGNAPGTHFC